MFSLMKMLEKPQGYVRFIHICNFNKLMVPIVVL